MDPRFNSIFTSPENDVFKVVFYPDRIYHAEYLNATRSPRYRYNVLEVRSEVDITLLKCEVYLDGKFLCNALRIEYRAGRLVEQVREKNRFLRDEILADIDVLPEGPAPASTRPSSSTTTNGSPPTRPKSGRPWSLPRRARTTSRCST